MKFAVLSLLPLGLAANDANLDGDQISLLQSKLVQSHVAAHAEPSACPSGWFTGGVDVVYNKGNKNQIGSFPDADQCYAFAMAAPHCNGARVVTWYKTTPYSNAGYRHSGELMEKFSGGGCSCVYGQFTERRGVGTYTTCILEKTLDNGGFDANPPSGTGCEDPANWITGTFSGRRSYWQVASSNRYYYDEDGNLAGAKADSITVPSKEDCGKVIGMDPTCFGADGFQWDENGFCQCQFEAKGNTHANTPPGHSCLLPGGVQPPTTAPPTTQAPTTTEAPDECGDDDAIPGTGSPGCGTEVPDKDCLDADIGFGPDFDCDTTTMFCGADSSDGISVGYCCPKKCKQEQEKKKKASTEAREKAERERKKKRRENERKRKQGERERKDKRKDGEWLEKRQSKEEKNKKKEEERKDKRNFAEGKRKKEREWKKNKRERQQKADKREKDRKEKREKKDGPPCLDAAGTDSPGGDTEVTGTDCFDADEGFGPGFDCDKTEMFCSDESDDGVLVGQCCPDKCKGENTKKCDNKNEEKRKKNEQERKSKRAENEKKRKANEKKRKADRTETEWKKKRVAKETENKKKEDERKTKRKFSESRRKQERSWKRNQKERRGKNRCNSQAGGDCKGKAEKEGKNKAKDEKKKKKNKDRQEKKKKDRKEKQDKKKKNKKR